MSHKYVLFKVGYQWCALPVEHLAVVAELIPVDHEQERPSYKSLYHRAEETQIEIKLISDFDPRQPANDPDPVVQPSQPVKPDLAPQSLVTETDAPTKFTPPDLREFVDLYRDGEKS